MQVKEAFLRAGSVLRLGGATLRFELVDGGNRLLISDRTAFGGMFGISAPMRASFALMERAAASDATVLLEGETGTGKGQAAEAIHQASARAKAPLIVVDCGAIPANLLESELFGHEKGAFTGAESRRLGAFEEADGGTIFLDEIGELPLDLQPKLLRVLENRQVRRLGGNVHRAIDVRVIAATNRDLRTEVNPGRFRADLYFRLAVVRITLPPLRERPEDLPLLVSRLLRRMGANEAMVERFSSRRVPERPVTVRVARQRPRAAQPPRALPGVRGAHAAHRQRRPRAPLHPRHASTRASPTPRAAAARWRASSRPTSARCWICTAARSPWRPAPPASTASTCTG